MRFLTRGALVTILALVAAPAVAFTSSAGDRYVAQCNANGAVLTSDGADTLYLGRSCDAFSQTDGTGLWGWANGGFSVVVGDRRVTFPRQDHPCWDAEVLPDFGGACTSPP